MSKPTKDSATLLTAGPALGPVGVALAGGNSSRLGQNKAALIRIGTRQADLQTPAGRPLDEPSGQTMSFLAWTCFRLRQVCQDIVIAAGEQEIPADAAVYPQVTDADAQGPARGVLGAARQYPGRTLLVLACDLPLVPITLLQHLTEGLLPRNAVGPLADIAAPQTAGGWHPLCAAYGARALDRLFAQAAQHRYRLQDLFATAGEDPLRVTTITPAGGSSRTESVDSSGDQASPAGAAQRIFVGLEEALLNVNTVNDFARYESLANSLRDPSVDVLSQSSLSRSNR